MSRHGAAHLGPTGPVIRVLLRWHTSCCLGIKMSTQRQTKILIADDDQDLRELVAENFRSRGYAVEEASDGEELRQKLEEGFAEERLPDLVLSDHVMPRLTGLEVLAWASCKAVQVPFVIVSAFSAPQVAKRGMQLGALRVFSKPVDLNELSGWVANTLGRAIPEGEHGPAESLKGSGTQSRDNKRPGDRPLGPESTTAPPTTRGEPYFRV